MKISTKYFERLVFYEKECIDFLEEQASHGYLLDKIGLFHVHFKPCQQPLKYQLDYNILTDEYLEIVHSLGYKQVAAVSENIHIFANENLNAPDLQSDDEVHQQVLLQQFKKSSIIGAIISGFFVCFILGNLLQFFFPITKRDFYMHYEIYILFIFLFLLGLYSIVYGILKLFKRKSIFNETYNYSHWYKFDKTLDIIINILKGAATLYTFTFVVMDTRPLFHKICFVMLLILFLISGHAQTFVIPKEENQKKKNVIAWLFNILIICCIVMLNTSNDYLKTSNIPHTFPAYQNIENETKNYFVYSISSKPYISLEEHTQMYYECRNEDVAKTIFDDEIITSERITRIPKIHGVYSSNDIKSLSYQEAFSKYEKLNSQVFEECYYINHIIVARHKNIVLRIVIDDFKNLDKTLKSYVTFKEA